MATRKRRRKKKCRTICFSRKRNGEFGKGHCKKTTRRRRKKSGHRAHKRKHGYSPRKHPRKANGQFKKKKRRSSHRARRVKYTPPSHQLTMGF